MKNCHNKKEAGFVIIFAVTLAAILLSVALGVANISEKEVKFTTSAKDTNNAFFAADTGLECATYNDKGTNGGSFPISGSSTTITCAGNTTTPGWTSSTSGNITTTVYTFTLTNIGSSSSGCAVVDITKVKNISSTIVATTVNSKGYNSGDSNCYSPSGGRVERSLTATYNSTTLAVLPTGCDTTFQADQFNVCYFDGISAPTDGATPVLSRAFEASVESPVYSWGGFDHQWANGLVGSSGKSDLVSAVWRSRVNFGGGNYVFHTISDDGVELTIDGNVVINDWNDHGPTEDIMATFVSGGSHDVQLRWYEDTGGAQLTLWWEYAGN